MTSSAAGAPPVDDGRPDGVTVVRDVVYAEVGGTDLHLDLYLPGTRPAPLTVWLHGGGWLRGSRADRAAERLLPMARSGVAVAAVQYRLSDSATFPAPLDDVRAAVRWLRAHAGEHGLDATRIGAWGASAGGHLAALLALTSDERDAELGDSSVQAAATWFAPSDLLRMASDVPEGPRPPFLTGPPPQPPYEARLLGADSAASRPDEARAASPIAHVHAGAPPFLLVHGDGDGLIPSEHSRRLFDALRAQGVPAQLWLLHGANHEDPGFDQPAGLAAVSGFLRATLLDDAAGAAW
ncbi:alpha/beta hydrolase fold domain-containing protein [Geodermatophilus sp. SYSU D00697]